METAERKTISVGTSSPLMILCLEIAFRHGLLSREKTIVFKPKKDKEILDGIINGTLDMGRTSAVQAIRANAAGKPIYTVAGFDNRMVHVILGSRSIASAAELKHRRAGINLAGDYTDQYMRAALRHLGLTPDKDIEVVAVGPNAERRRQLAADDIQVTIVSQIHGLRLRAEGYPWLVEMADVFPSYPNKVIAAGAKALSENPQGVKTIIKAMIQGYRYLNDPQNDEEINGIIPTLDYENFKLRMETLFVRRSRKPSNTGRVTMQGLQIVLKEAIKRGDVAADYNLSQLLKTGPLSEAQRELGIAD